MSSSRLVMWNVWRTHTFLLIIIFSCFWSVKASVSYDHKAIVVNGYRRILISGSIHYPRSTPEMWPDLIQKAKDGGLDVIETYVFWNGHEPSPGKYYFEGRYDLVRFVKLVKQAGLYVHLRIGPYVCAEWNFGKETRVKIGVGVRIGWQRRREKLMLQETCCFEWQNLIAEASRRGYAGEEELKWDSYKILDEQLGQEWLESIEHRKSTPRPKGSKRAPKSLEQRKKISAAIAAKWADPGYRERVYSALSKYHGTPVGAERKPRRRPSGDPQSVRRSSVKEKAKASNTINGSGKETKNLGQSRVKRSRAAPYRDPLADSKLEMIKNIRAQRADMETKKIEAVQRAKLLIAEAMKAAKALEMAAAKSPLARASLMETRKLIAEATHSIKVIETGQTLSRGSKDGSYSSFESSGLGKHHVETNIGNEGLTLPNKNEVNGIHAPMLSNNGSADFDFRKFALQNLLDSGEPVEPISMGHASPQLEYDNPVDQLDSKEKKMEILRFSHVEDDYYAETFQAERWAIWFNYL